jgi:ribosomal protein S12 methylthiotransferase accessory factor
MEIVVSLPGGRRVDVQVGRYTLHTDQPLELGGEASAPDPFSVVLASLAACAGSYVLAFCQARGIPSSDIQIVETTQNDPHTGRPASLSLEIHLPASFPERYRSAVAHAAAACKVKRVLLDPPRIDITTVVASAAGDATAA